MKFTHLLAKSCPDPENPPFEATLEGHTLAVIRSFQALFGARDQPSRLADQWLKLFKLTRDRFPAFFLNGLTSCLIHDLGKANSGFQAMIRRKGKQQFRHEHLSAIFLFAVELKEWIAEIDNVDGRIIVSTVLGHHLKAAPRNRNFAQSLDGGRTRFSLDINLLAEVLSSMSDAVPELDKSPAALTLPEKWNLGRAGGAGTELKEQAERLLKKFDRTLKKDTELLRLLLAVRAGFILADSAGSGLVREGRKIESWLEHAFSDTELLTGERIDSDILLPRQKAIEKNAGHPFSWQDFQKEAGKLPARALLISACGSGKTLAAWRWIRSRLTENPAGRAIFLYPTRATANEGFRDYVSWAPEGILLHSSAGFDIQGMFENPDDRPGSGKFLMEERLFALAYWNRRIFSATVHQFLGFMQHSYRSVCLLPLLADSVVVVDEVHSFNTALFSALKQFLANFNVPVLCMTATLPQQRQKELAELRMTIFPDSPDDFKDLWSKTAAPRYHIRFLGNNPENVEDNVHEALAGKKKILWVVNTVDRCQELAEKLQALCYHSRFKLEDRKCRHEEVVKAFQAEAGPLLAITTQVCEMSLDLDADVLISESAPITSLIQRMGRCNRHLKCEGPGKVFIYNPMDEKPYTYEDLTGVEDFIAALNNKTVNQQVLDDLLIKFGDSSREVKRYSAFLQDRAWAESREKELAGIRESSVQAILDSDIGRYFDLRKAKQPIDGLLLPVPRNPEGLAWQDDRIGRFPHVASAIHYEKQYGFTKHPRGIIL